MIFEIVTPSVKLLDITHKQEGIEILRRIEWIGRISHRTEEKQTTESWKRFITSVILNHGDWSITEHALLTVMAVIDRGISHEWVRHRIGAYTQESTRFVNYAKEYTKTAEMINPFRFIEPSLIGERTKKRWRDHRENNVCEYNYYIDHGYSPQIARNCLPNCLATTLIATYNLRMWRHFFIMRTCKEAHPQMLQVTIPLLEQFKALIPLLYDDIIPEQKQRDNLCLPC
jgi:thymidylate synthase (FAD)